MEASVRSFSADEVKKMTTKVGGCLVWGGATNIAPADDKIIAVPAKDPRWNDVKDLEDLNEHTLREIAHFYSTYKDLQDKEVIVKGFKGAKEARQAFTEGLKLYKELNKKTESKKK